MTNTKKNTMVNFANSANQRGEVMAKAINRRYGLGITEDNEVVLNAGASIISKDINKVRYSLFYSGNGEALKTIQLGLGARIKSMTDDGLVTFDEANGVESLMQLDKELLPKPKVEARSTFDSKAKVKLKEELVAELVETFFKELLK